MNTELISGTDSRDLVMRKYSKLAEGISELDNIDIAITNFSKTLEGNPNLSAVISPQLEARKKEKLRLLEKLFNSINASSLEGSNLEEVKREIESVELTLSNLKNTLQSNTALSAVIQPQIDLKKERLSFLKQIFKSSNSGLVFSQNGKDVELIEAEIREELESRKALLSEANVKVESLNNQLEVTKNKVDEESNKSSKRPPL